jgi:hypothetical protein
MVLIAGLPMISTSCLALGGAKSVSVGTAVHSRYLFRGVPLVDAPVSQSNLDVALELESGDSVGLGIWANMDLSNDTGDAVFPDGNGGKVTEIDFVPTYSTSFGGTAVDFGITNYNFANGVGASTNEFFVALSRDFGALGGGLTINYDFDEVEDYYLSLSVSKGLEVNEKTTVSAAVNLGIAGEDQGLAYWGAQASGLSDVNFSLSFYNQASEAVVLSAGLVISSIINSDYEDALDLAGIDTDNVVFWVGMSF